jgi:hypothetical protein
VGKGSRFTVVLPVEQPAGDEYRSLPALGPRTPVPLPASVLAETGEG